MKQKDKSNWNISLRALGTIARFIQREVIRMQRKYYTLLIPVVCCFLLNCGSMSSDWYEYDSAMSWGVAVNDLNGDGAVDIAVTTTYIEDFDDDDNHYVSVILNDKNSPGDYFPVEHYWVPTSDDLVSVALGDLNDDGFSDIITENGRRIFILFQDPASPGDFLSPMAIDVNKHMAYITIGDLNEDGFNDIAVGSYNGPHLSILFQDSTNPGNFLPLVSIGLSSSSVAIGDLNGDFINDMAVTGGGYVRLLFQNPTVPGAFFAPVVLAAEKNAVDVKIGDLDKDGRLDLVVGHSGGNSAGSISMMLQDPTNPGEFIQSDNYKIACSILEISLGDLNNDGFLDTAIASWCQNSPITILFQDISAIGTFLPPAKYSSNDGMPWSIATGDMNGDNLDDVIVSDDSVLIRWQSPSASGTFNKGEFVYYPNS